ncbi:MAG: ParA family protein [Bacillota bacterium]
MVIFMLVIYNNINNILNERMITIPVIAINNNKGGVLKTSLTINLAGVLATMGKKVLIMDCDNQGNVSVSFRLNPDNFKHTIYDVLVNDYSPKEAIINVYKDKGLIDVLPANDELMHIDFKVIGNMEKYKNPFNLIKRNCFKLKEEYDYILIDSPPSLGLMVGNIFTFTDYVLIPFQPEEYARRSLVKILKAINDFTKSMNPKLKVLGILPTLVDSRTNLHSEVLKLTRQFGEEKGFKVFDTVIPRSIKFPTSVAYEGLPPTISNPNHTVIQKYYELWREIEDDIK